MLLALSMFFEYFALLSVGTSGAWVARDDATLRREYQVREGFFYHPEYYALGA